MSYLHLLTVSFLPFLLLNMFLFSFLLVDRNNNNIIIINNKEWIKDGFVLGNQQKTVSGQKEKCVKGNRGCQAVESVGRNFLFLSVIISNDQTRSKKRKKTNS